MSYAQGQNDDLSTEVPMSKAAPLRLPMFNGTCVYVHRRATDGKIFYVGMGTRARARSKTSRNATWLATEAEHGRLVQVVDVFDEPDDAAAAEVELIDLLVAMGVELVNRSAGGEGRKPYEIRTPEQAYAKTKGLMDRLDAARALRMRIQHWRNTVLRDYRHPVTGMPVRWRQPV